VTESEWLSCTDPDAMLTYLGRPTRWPRRLFQARRQVVSSRKLRLFACACCRRNVPKDGRFWFHQAVGLAERVAEGVATPDQRRLARRVVDYAYWWPPLKYLLADPTDWDAYDMNWQHWDDDARRWQQGGMATSPLLHDIVGNPFRPVTIDPAWLTGTVKQLALAAYEERELPSGHLDRQRLAVLADALEEAGCQDAELLEHLRSKKVHVRGCWALDLLLNKE
jgi:hypothetical protein